MSDTPIAVERPHVSEYDLCAAHLAESMNNLETTKRNLRSTKERVIELEHRVDDLCDEVETYNAELQELIRKSRET